MAEMPRKNIRRRMETQLKRSNGSKEHKASWYLKDPSHWAERPISSEPYPRFYPNEDYSTPPPLLTAPAYMPDHREFYSKEDKKAEFSYFLKTLSSLIVQAKNDDTDMCLLREVLGDVVLGKPMAMQPDPALHRRLDAIENSLATASNLSARLYAIEAQLASNPKPFPTNLQPIGDTSLLARLERTEKQISDANVFGRLALIENQLSSLHNRRTENTTSTEEAILNRVQHLENQMATGASVLHRLDAVESRLAAVESRNPPVYSRNPCVESRNNASNSQSVEVLDLDSDEQHSGPPSSVIVASPKRAKTSEQEDIKLEPVEPDIMRFLMGQDDSVSVFIEGAGVKKKKPGIRVWFGHEHPMNVSRPLSWETSSNKAELNAALLAIDISFHAGMKKITVHTCSVFLIKCMKKLQIWARRQWRRKDGKRLKHTRQLKKIHRSCRAIAVFFKEERDYNKARCLADPSFIKEEVE